MKFDIFAIVVMIIAIFVGQVVGGMVEGYLGVGGMTGILGTLASIVVVGFLTYLVYTLVTGGKINAMLGLIFAFVVYISNMVAGYIAQGFGFSGGLISLVVVGVVASLIWGWVGGQAGAKQVKQPVSLGKK